MNRKLKHVIAISLVIIFLMPMTVKLLDSQFHHHDHFICTAKHELHFHEHYHRCLVQYYDHLSTLKLLNYYNQGRNVSVSLKVPFETHML